MSVTIAILEQINQAHYDYAKEHTDAPEILTCATYQMLDEICMDAEFYHNAKPALPPLEAVKEFFQARGSSLRIVRGKEAVALTIAKGNRGKKCQY